MGTLAVYDSIEDVAEVLNARPRLCYMDNESFYGIKDKAELFDKMLNGDAALGAEVKEFVNNFRVSLKTVGRRYGMDVAGSSPSVPHYLAGDPMNMRRKMPQTVERGRMRMFIDVGISAGCSRQAILNRGKGIAALAWNLCTVRPVELYIIDNSNSYDPKDVGAANYSIRCIRIPSAPLDVNRLAALVAHPMGGRSLMFNLWDENGTERGDIGWAWGDYHMQSDAAKFRKRLAPILGLTDDDLVFPGGLVGTIGEPGEWVRDQLTKLGMIAE